MAERNICIILPTLNEELAIGNVLEEIPHEALEGMGCQVDVIVVDGRSTDQTMQIARDKGARIIIEPREGKGRAIRTALEETKADFIFMLDGDYTYPATYLPSMIEILKDCPVVIGSRLKGRREQGALSRLNFIGNYILTWLANALYRTRISDLCTGYWGFRAEVIQNLKLRSEGFQLEAELLTQISKRGYKIGEVPILYRTRQGKAKLSGLKEGIRIAWLLITERFHS
jgi:glycosyltransferase involved in cell wall biosynthesis